MGTAKKAAEKRKYIRINLSRVARISKYQFGAGDEKLPNVVSNISAGGIMFKTNSAYDIGSLIKIEIDIPGWYKHRSEFYKNPADVSKPFVALATVVRIEIVDTPDHKYEIGACFVNIDQGHLDALMKFVKSIAEK